MAGTVTGARARAAAHLGLTVDEYERRLARGLKWCSPCKAWHPRTEFDIDRSRGDGLAAGCREARRHLQRIPFELQKPKGPRGGTHTPEARAKIAAASKGRQSTRRGVPRSVETRRKISAAVRERTPRGDACHSYKDGKLVERRGERHSAEYKRWRFDVFARDEFTCQSCGDARGGNLVAHHLKGFAEFPELRYDVDNGITWCVPCHKAHHEEHGYG